MEGKRQYPSLATARDNGQSLRQRPLFWQKILDWFSLHTLVPSWLPLSLRYPYVGYLVACVMMGMLLLVKWQLTIELQPFTTAYTLLLFLPVVVLAVSWGAGPALFATFLAAGGEISWQPTLSHVIGSGSFLLVGSITSVIVGRLQRVRRDTDGLVSSLAVERVRLEAVLDAIPDALGMYDAAGQLVRLNSGARRFESLFRDASILMHGSVTARLRTSTGNLLSSDVFPLLQVLEGKRASEVEAVYIDEHGETLDVLLHAIPFHCSGGRISGAIAIVREMSERRKLERHTRSVLEAVVGVVEILLHEKEGGSSQFTYDVTQRLLELTRKALAYDHISMIALKSSEQTLYPLAYAGLEDDYESQFWLHVPGVPLATWLADTCYLEQLQLGEVVLLEPVLKNQLVAPPGCLTLIAPMLLHDQLVGVLTVSCSDASHVFSCEEQMLAKVVAHLSALIIEREHLLREREEAHAQALALHETQRRMEAFLGMVSHELRNPLAMILLSSELFMRWIDRLPRQEKWTEKQLTGLQDLGKNMKGQVGNLNRLVEDLLQASRLQSGKFSCQMEPCQLSTIVSQVVEEQRQLAPIRTILLTLPPEGDLSLVVDPRRIAQVVANYLTNALKYSPDDCPVEVVIQIEVDTCGRWVSVQVRDAGPGLTADECQRIWERFYQIDRITSKQIGLGLGLSICRTIIEQHNGQVGVESKPGIGSTFWFRLPLGDESEEEARST